MYARPRLLLAPLALAVLLAGCASTGTTSGSSPVTYADDARWLCLPGRQDPCSETRRIVERQADGRDVPVADVPAAKDSDVDCFYIYPTVSMSLIPRNADNFHDYREETAEVTKVQAASFRSACRLFVPLYRQGTIATYILPETLRQRHVAVALADVRAAFDHYMAHQNHGRKVVLIGHSQGAELTTRLLQERFDGSPAMRRQLLLAIVAGAPVHVRKNSTVGGDFTVIPTCSRPRETGCVVTFMSFIEGAPAKADTRLPSLARQEEACVNPATLDVPGIPSEERRSRRAVLSGTLLPPPAWSLGGVRGDKSSRTFTRIAGGYTAACVDAPGGGFRYLSIAEEMAPGDPRREAVPFDSDKLRGWLGLHVLDMQFSAADLVDLVKIRSRAIAR